VHIHNGMFAVSFIILSKNSNKNENYIMFAVQWNSHKKCITKLWSGRFKNKRM